MTPVLFAFQIYGDFPAIPDIAQGCARLLGHPAFRQFPHPLRRRNIFIRDFWRKWHRSLTLGWFTDYLLYPLWRQPCRRIRMTCRNILRTLPGQRPVARRADWTLDRPLGGLHGVYLILERFLFRNRSPTLLPTFLAVCLS